MGLPQRCQKVYQAMSELRIKSLRALARATNISKSSVHRLSQRIKHRQQHPESYFWETPEGYEWLKILVSGYILLEKKTSDRKYQTWFDHVQVALSQIGPTVLIKSLVSDRAKALVQLAVQGLGCQSRPDLFHGMRCLSRSIGARLGGQLARTKRQLQQINA